MSTATQTLDARGLNCPLPILRTKKALNSLQTGDTLQIHASDPGSVKDMQSFCQQTGNELVSSNDSNGEFSFLIRKA
ncbi:MAG: sulfurtransferase TusA family protein [Thiothrix sp.]